MRIAVIDGQGGGIGKHITEQIRKGLRHKVEIVALGTNSVATALMLPGRSQRGGYRGECRGPDYGRGGCDHRPDLRPGCQFHAWRGNSRDGGSYRGQQGLEAVASHCRSRIEIVGVQSEPLPHMVEKLVQLLKELKPKKELQRTVRGD